MRTNTLREPNIFSSCNVTFDFLPRTLQSWQRPEPMCISNCNCYTASVSPVCGSNGVTYLSACFAGCTKPVSEGAGCIKAAITLRRIRGWFDSSNRSRITRLNVIPCLFFSFLCQNLSSCACISSNSEEAVALPGKCPSPGCQEAFLTFLCVICVCSMIGAMAQTPSVIILIRQVDLHRLPRRGSYWH